MAVEYKFKPYTPVNLKLASPQASLSQEEKTRKSLEAQRANLDARLRAEGIDPETLGGEFDNRNLIEKALNLTPDQNLLFDFFEVINRPVEAVKGAITAGIEGKSVLEGAWEGISGQEVTPGSELFKDLTGIEPETGVGKFIVDVGVDILLDPLTYVPAGFFLKGFKKLNSRTLTNIIQNSDKLYTEALENLFKKIPLEKGESVANYIKRIELNKTDDVLRFGLQTDFDNVKYLANDNLDYAFSVTGLKKRAELLDEMYSRAPVVVESVSRTGKKTKTRYVANADGTASRLRYSEAVKSELDFYKQIKDVLEVDDSIKVVLTSTDNTRPDIVVLKRVEGTDDFLQIGTFEVKKLNGATLSSATLQIDDAGRVIFSKGKGAFKYSDGLNQKFSDFLQNTKIMYEGSEQSLEDVLKKLKTTTGERTKNIEELIANAPKEVQEQYKDVIFDMLDEKGVKEFTFATSDGRVFFLTADEARKYGKLKDITGFSETGTKAARAAKPAKVKDFLSKLKSGTLDTAKLTKTQQNLYDFLVDFVGGKSNLKQILQDNAQSLDDLADEVAQALSSQFRFRPTIVIDEAAEAAMKADGVGLNLDTIANRYVGQTTLERQVGVLEYLGQTKGGRLGALAKAADNFLKKFTSLFSLKSALGDETYSKLKKILGETMFDLERRSARLASLKENLIKIDPKAGELLSELIEAGAYIDAAGNIKRLKRSVGLSDFLDYSLKRTEDGVEIILPQFADEAMRVNFLKRINKLYEESVTGVDDFFNIIEQNGATVLKFNGDTSDLKEFIKWIDNQKMLNNTNIPNYVMFGEKRLSEAAKKLLKEGNQFITEYQKISDDVLRELVEKAGFENLPRELSGQIGYMRHIMTKEAYEMLARKSHKVASLFARPGSDVLARRTFLGSVDEINAGLKEFMGLQMDLFDPNAFNAMEDLIKIAQRKLEQRQILDLVLNATGRDGQRLMRVASNLRDTPIGPTEIAFKKFEETFSALHKNLSPDGQTAMRNFLKAQGYTEDTMIVMNKSAYDVLKRVEKAYVEIPQLIKTYDKFLNTWKGLTLITPGFHLRNLFGNMFNSYAAGMGLLDQSKYLRTAMLELDEFQKIGKKLAQGLDLTPKEQKLFQLVKGYFDNGVSQTHRGIRDLEQLKEMAEEIKNAGKLKTGYNNLIRFNFNVAEKMDDVQRYMLYRWSLDSTGDATQAARKVSEALFDYSHLTPFEKDYMKRVFPFYTFMKNNFIFQAKNIFANPKAYARTGRAYKYAIEDLAGYSPEDLPDYTTENMWLPIPMTVNKNDKEAIAFLKTNLPLSDFTELVENPFKKGVISLTAPVKLLIEFGAGRDLFTGAPLTQFPGQKNAMEPGTGVFSALRDSRGNFTVTQSPIAQKIMNDIGLRTPLNVVGVGVDILDTIAGYQGTPEGLGDFMVRASIVGIQERDNIELTTLYQDLEKLRELKKFYEQETGNQLPVLP
jgi:hypothetical protein